MTSVLLRSAKRRKTVQKFASGKVVTIFKIYTYGSTETRPIATNVINDINYIVVDGLHTDCPLKLQLNQKAYLIK